MKLTMCKNSNEPEKRINMFNRYDGLISIDFDDIITAVESNEKEYTEEAVWHVFSEILQTALQDAKHELNTKMAYILNELGEAK